MEISWSAYICSSGHCFWVVWTYSKPQKLTMFDLLYLQTTLVRQSLYVSHFISFGSYLTSISGPSLQCEQKTVHECNVEYTCIQDRDWRLCGLEYGECFYCMVCICVIETYLNDDKTTPTKQSDHFLLAVSFERTGLQISESFSHLMSSLDNKDWTESGLQDGDIS